MLSNTPDSKGYISSSQIPSTPPPSTDTSAQPTIGNIEGRAAAAPPPEHVEEVAKRAEPPAHKQMYEFGVATVVPHPPIPRLTLEQEGEPPRAQTPKASPTTTGSQAPRQENRPPLTRPPGLKPPPGPLPKPPEGVAPYSVGRALTTPPTSDPNRPFGSPTSATPRPLPPTPTPKASPTTTGSQAPRQESRPPLTRPPGLKPPPGPLPKPPEGVAPYSVGRALPTPPTSVPNRPVGRSASAPPTPSTAPVSPLRMTAAQLYEKTQEAQNTGTYDAELHQAIRTKLNDLAGDADLMAASSKAQEAYAKLKEANITLSELAPKQQATPPTSTNPLSPGPKSAPGSSKDIDQMSEAEKKELRDAGVDIEETPTAGADSSAPTNIPQSVNQQKIPETIRKQTSPQQRTRAATTPPPVTYSTAAPPPSLNATKSKELDAEIKELRTKIDSRKYAVRSVALKILRFGDPKLKLEAELKQKQIERRCLNLPEAVIRDFEADPKNLNNIQAIAILSSVLDGTEVTNDNASRLTELKKNIVQAKFNQEIEQLNTLSAAIQQSQPKERRAKVTEYNTQLKGLIDKVSSEALSLDHEVAKTMLDALRQANATFSQKTATLGLPKPPSVPQLSTLLLLQRMAPLFSQISEKSIQALVNLNHRNLNLKAEAKGPLSSHMELVSDGFSNFNETRNVSNLFNKAILALTDMKDIGAFSIPPEKYVHIGALGQFLDYLKTAKSEFEGDETLQPLINEMQAVYDEAIAFQTTVTNESYGPRMETEFSKIPSTGLLYQPNGTQVQTDWSAADAKLTSLQEKTFPLNPELDSHFDQWLQGKSGLTEKEYCGDGLMLFKRGNVRASAVVDADASGQDSAEATAAVLKVIENKMNQLPSNLTPEASQQFCQEIINEAHKECIRIGKQCTLTFNMYIPMQNGQELLVGFSLGDAFTVIEKNGELEILTPDPQNPDGSPRNVGSNGNALGCTTAAREDRQFNAYVRVLDKGTKVHQASDYTRDNFQVVQQNVSKGMSFKEAALKAEEAKKQYTDPLKQKMDELKKATQAMKNMSSTPADKGALLSQVNDSLTALEQMHGANLDPEQFKQAVLADGCQEPSIQKYLDQFFSCIEALKEAKELLESNKSHPEDLSKKLAEKTDQALHAAEIFHGKGAKAPLHPTLGRFKPDDNSGASYTVGGKE